MSASLKKHGEQVWIKDVDLGACPQKVKSSRMSDITQGQCRVRRGTNLELWGIPRLSVARTCGRVLDLGTKAFRNTCPELGWMLSGVSCLRAFRLDKD